MYKLKEGVSWENVKIAIEFVDVTNLDDDFKNYFEKIELPVVEFENKINMIEREINNKWCIIVRERYIEVGKFFNNGSDYNIILIGKDYEIKSISDFNEKCALLFGFYLKEV